MAKKSNMVIADFSNVGGGLNTTDDMLLIGKNQVQQCMDAKLFRYGIFRVPGTEAGGAVLANNGRGIFIYRKLDGTETIIFMSDGKLYSAPSTIDSKTELFDLTGTEKAYFANYLDKCFVCNGTEVVKVEGSNCYQVGISPPSGVNVAASAGGTLQDGTYTVYACYARRVSGDNVLFSVGENVGDVVLGSGNNTIAITSFANSSDAQVGNKIIFLTEPSSGVTYQYHETGDNSTTSFNITSDANKNTAVIYDTVASENTRPSAFEYLIAFNGSIYGLVSNTLYKSIKNTSNVYDLERFTSNLVLPFEGKGLFSLGEHLYVNTTGGIIVIPYGDISAEWDKLTDDYFYEINTVREVSERRIIGLTYQGIKYFDGQKFFGHDLSRDIKDEIRKIYTTTSGFSPFGILVRTNERLEYHLGYNDSSVSEATNNVRLVLNVDEVQLLPNNRTIAPWEIWSSGFNYACVNLNQIMFMLQDHASVPILYKLNTNNTFDNGTYKNDGTLASAQDNKEISVTFRAYNIDLMTMVRWYLVSMMVKAISSLTVYLYIREGDQNRTDNVTIDAGGTDNLWAESTVDDDELIWDEDVWGVDELVLNTAKTDDDMKGYVMYMKFTQTQNDNDFHILRTEAHGIPVQNQYTEIGG